MRNTYSEVSLPYNDSHYQLPLFKIQNPVQYQLEQAAATERYVKERVNADNDYYKQTLQLTKKNVINCYG